MGNSPSKQGNGPVIVAEALQPLPRYHDICAVLGGVNRRDHMIMKTSVGFAAGKFTLKDCKGDGNTVLLKSEVRTKSSRKRTSTKVTSAQGQELLRIEGTHECLAIRKGCITSSRGIMGEEDADLAPNDVGAGSPLNTTAALNSPYGQSNMDIAFVARALDHTFFDWGIELRNLSSLGGRERSVTIWTEENPAMGTIDFTYEGSPVARIASSPGASILWNGNKYEVGKNQIAIVVAPGMDWSLIGTLCFLLMSRKADHDVGVSTRAGDLSLLSGLFDESGDPDAMTRSTSSIGTSSRSSGKGNKGPRRAPRSDRIAEE
ncbi:unnamed protein product [Sympodiomycopsis kandeliae]